MSEREEKQQYEKKKKKKGGLQHKELHILNIHITSCGKRMLCKDRKRGPGAARRDFKGLYNARFPLPRFSNNNVSL